MSGFFYYKKTLLTRIFTDWLQNTIKVRHITMVITQDLKNLIQKISWSSMSKNTCKYSLKDYIQFSEKSYNWQHLSYYGLILDFDIILLYLSCMLFNSFLLSHYILFSGNNKKNINMAFPTSKKKYNEQYTYVSSTLECIWMSSVTIKIVYVDK